MKRIIGIPMLLLAGLYACNSGSSNQSASSDSTNTKMADTSSTKTDTSHTAMNMSSIEALPEIPKGAKVFFKNLKNNETVKSPVKVEMGVTGMSVDSAGKVKQASGHFHILIDAGDSFPSGIVVPKDSLHLHFGNAQKEARVNLAPGKHTLTIQFADGIHRSYGAQLAKAITVTVK